MIKYIDNQEKASRKWCSENDFISMLPEDAKARCNAAGGPKQTTLGDRFTGALKEVQFSQSLFKEKAYEWLIDTDQVSSSNSIQRNRNQQ